MAHLNDPQEHPLGSKLVNYPDLDFLGEKLDKETAQKICLGTWDPITLAPYQQMDQSSGTMKVYKRKPRVKKQTGKTKEAKAV